MIEIGTILTSLPPHVNFTDRVSLNVLTCVKLNFLTNPLTSKSTKPELVSDKKRAVLEMNKSDKRAEKEAKITSIDDIVDKQMDHNYFSLKRCCQFH
jgi:hypothetical protein